MLSKGGGATYFDVSARGERGENEKEPQTQNHHVESPSVRHGSAQRLISRTVQMIPGRKASTDTAGLQI